uniref:Tankyrase n=1 Tax=Timema douglasi TaxID=61478 RepID=A0A7R8VPS6_TIMDO|nr:unnamed protein product [Timema douglasi]
MANRRSVMSTSAEPPSSSNNDPLRELFEACKTGDIVRVKKLVNPQTVNARDTAGRKSTPLHFAAGHNVTLIEGYGRRDVVEFLLATGASIQARDDGGLHPLHNACSFGHADVVRLLLEAGANPNTRDNWNYTPLHEAAIKGKVDVCIALLQHGGDANIRNTEGKTALELSDSAARPVLTGDHRKEELLEAARSGAEDRLVALLNPLNVNCHASDGRRSTPLHLAAGYNRNRVVQLLLQHGADVHAKDKGERDHARASHEQSPGLGIPSQQGGGGHSNRPSVGINQIGARPKTLDEAMTVAVETESTIEVECSRTLPAHTCGNEMPTNPPGMEVGLTL